MITAPSNDVRETTPPASGGDGIGTHLYVLIPIVLVLVVFMWMVTAGSFDLARQEFLGRFYDAQADAFAQGRWDIPLDSIYPEEFVHDGKYYGYPGFVPALPRVVLNRFFPTMDGRWSRTSLCVACLVTLWFSYQLLLIAKRWTSPGEPMGAGTKVLYSLFLILVGLGSTTIFLASKSFMYHEAIIWAVAFSLGCYAHLLDYFLEGRFRNLIAAGVLAFLSFFSRISTGSGPVLALILVGIAIIAWRGPRDTGRIRRAARWLGQWTSPPPLLHAMAAWLAAGVIVAMYLWTNHSKFGTWVEAVPMRMYQILRDHPSSEWRAGRSWMNVGNIPTTIYAYFWPGNMLLRPTFPWIWMTTTMKEFSCSRMGGCGAYANIPATMPILLIFALAGLVMVRRLELGVIISRPSTGKARPFPPLILLSTLAVIGLIFAFFNVDHRYIHEFLPPIVILGAFGLNLRPRRGPIAMRVALATLVVASILQVYTNTAFALEYQRQLVFNMAKERSPANEFIRWQTEVDGFVHSILHGK